MSFVTTIDVNDRYKAEAMKNMFEDVSGLQSSELKNHYLYLLEIESLNYNIHWLVKEGKVRLELPLVEKWRDRDILTLGVKEDSLSSLLSEIIQRVTVERVKSHFQRR